MIDKANEIYQLIMSNQILLAAIGLSGAGILTFWLKDVPRSIYNAFKREFTTQVTIPSRYKVYYDLLNFIENKYPNKNFRKLKVTNNIYTDDGICLSIGYGIHFIKYKNHFFYINLKKEEANQTDNIKDTISITKLGRSRKIFETLLNDIEKNSNLSRHNGIKLSVYNSRCWEYHTPPFRRELSTIFIEHEKREILLSTLNEFINSEEWYVNSGIPYQLGILLYGPPGTGKTSLIKAISSFLNYSIYYMPTIHLNDISSAFSDVPNNCIIVIEDIDSNITTHARNKPKHVSHDDDYETIKELSLGNISEILNALDGMFSIHGRIFIATTNHIEKLDDALLRPGRIDLKLEVGYVNNEILCQFMKHFFPDSKIDFSRILIKDKLTVATLQGMVLQKYTDMDVLREISENQYIKVIDTKRLEEAK